MIEVDCLSKTYQGVSALSEVSLAVPTGSILALLGHNGAGKTTTVQILSTLIPPTSGRARVGGYDVVEQAAQVRESIGVTGQSACLDELLTGRENLALFGRLRGLRRRDARRRADELIEQFDLGRAADRPVQTYSGGMRRRVDIAIALVMTPKVLFLDEPTTGLDPRSRRQVWELVSSLAAEGVTVLLTTQYLEEADVLSDSIVILNAGRVVASGTSEELKARTGATYCQVTLVHPADIPRVSAALAHIDEVDADAESNTVSVRAADGVGTLGEVVRRTDQLGVELIDISLRKPTLDEVFLHLTPAASTL
ncbi:daunorubicin resistance ABC transporter ATP-binding subunit [Mycolicibacterium aurum]|uniref:Daunorubicin resistance ABC transporter ATP-binding subunit n=1 Tax=Mycolicibacterium aurum TaxID=1791 RepID=A0A3S4S2A6_MYCAU|nr:daunorubicin/doxorubicin resistance ABC transporter ATP-binding protein DrrA [Mycolicibacterium aurum]VEG54649.1 daunorubicin resistance ABC transporter ATP-binding subunit [Mycolicibacterium aurum]